MSLKTQKEETRVKRGPSSKPFKGYRMGTSYDRMFVICPTTVTGGPEALHQLAQLANEAGIDSLLAYYGEGATVSTSRGVLKVEAPARNPCLVAYAKYNPIVASGEYELDSRSLVILPEVIGWHAKRFHPAKVMVWWLSVNNAFHPKSPLKDEAQRTAFFADDAVDHLCQTFYAAAVLERQGMRRTYELVDYTDDLFTLRRPQAPNFGDQIAFNPKKGPELARIFFGANSDLMPRPIENMNKGQIAEVFRQTRIYVEFGHNPGKDRMPREAACAGCIVVARRAGGTAFFGDSPLPAKFKFSDADVASGHLADLVRSIARDPQPFWEEQSYYRRYLYSERDLMELQVKRLFGN